MKICIVRFGGMGDILLSTPTVRALAQRYEGAAIDYIVDRGMQEALTGLSSLRDVIPFDKRGADARPGPFLVFLRRLRAARYDLFLNLQPSAKSYLMALAAGARTLTHRKDLRVQPGTGRVRHSIDDFAKEIAPLGIAVTDRTLSFAVPAAAQERAAALAAQRWPGRPFIAVNPAGTREINRWPEGRFAALLDRLAAARPEHALVLVGGPGDAALAERIEKATAAAVHNLAGALSVKELGALLAQADAFVTGDTGPLHIASAVGARIVCLSGAADPDRTGPTRPGDLVVIHRDLSCVPCRDRVCRRKDIACMTQMPVEWVLDAVQRRIDGA